MTVTGSVLGWRALRHTGVLTWDGQVWCLHDQGLGCEDALGEVSVVLDVQKALLLRWQPTSDTVSQKPVWLWLGVEHAQVRWPALRRAIYQRTEMN